MNDAVTTGIEALQAQLGALASGQVEVTTVISRLHDLVDHCGDEEYLGLADALALFAELLEQLPVGDLIEAEQQVLLDDCGRALYELVSEVQPEACQYLLACLTDPRWREPVSEDDCSFLAEILEQDRKVFADWQAKNVDAKVETPATSPFSESVLLVIQQLERLGTDNSLEESLVKQFHALLDNSSELDYPGFADLFALCAELIENGYQGEQPAQLAATLRQLFSAPGEAHVLQLLELMADSGWSEPLPEDDRSFLQEILLLDAERLGEKISAFEPQAPDSTPTDGQHPDQDSVDVLSVDEESLDTLVVDEVRADAAIVTAEAVDEQASEQQAIESGNEGFSVTAEKEQQSEIQPQQFCSIDFTLLKDDGPVIDPAVLAMLADSLSGLEQQWQQVRVLPQALPGITLEALQPIQRALQTLHLQGMQRILHGLEVNLDYLQQHPDSLDDRLTLQFAAVLRAIVEHVSDISDKSKQQALLDQLLATDLPSAPTTEQVSFLAGLLSLASISSYDSLEQEQAVSEDIQLTVSDDIDPQLLEMLFNELPQLSEQLIGHLQQVIHAADLDELRSAQRASHTIKGLANMAGIIGLASLTHRLEDILELLSDASQLPGDLLSEDMIATADCIAAMSEAVIVGGESPANALQILQGVMDWHYRLKTEGVNQASAAKPADGAVVEDQQSLAKETPEAVKQEPAPAENILFRVQQKTLDSLLRLAGESSTLNTQLDEEIIQLRSYTRISRDRHRAMQRVIFELEQQLNEYYTLQPSLDEQAAEFDPLEMDRYSEMHTSLSRLQEAAADIREVEQAMDGHIRRAGELHIAQSGLQKETLEQVLSTRLVEVKTISARMQRILRQACRAAGKQAEMIISGEQTRIDSHILNQLADPLMHIIRNAVDHGLESPQARAASGKPEQGRIELSFQLENDLIRVSCSDDGAGIDTRQISAVAQTKGLIEPDTQLSEPDLQRLILMPGFTTREQISQLSGRGIGMDVVNQQIMRLQGTLDISSQAGQGARFELSMPASSLMIKTLLVRAGKQIYALSSHGIEQSIISLDGRLVETEQGAVFEYAEHSYPAYALEQLIAEQGSRYDADQIHPVLLVNLGQGETVAVLVREVIAHRELAFKDMGKYVPDIPGIPGLTILANGDTAPVVDLPARVRYKRGALTDLFTPLAMTDAYALPKLLVVDDSLSARSSLSTLLRDTGYEVRTAIDGLDALNQIRKDPPDLVLTDLEMPRMSGMELTTMIRGRQEMTHIPVVMITSRSTGRHRDEADRAGVTAYLTKPWTENLLLDQVANLLTPETATHSL